MNNETFAYDFGVLLENCQVKYIKLNHTNLNDNQFLSILNVLPTTNITKFNFAESRELIDHGSQFSNLLCEVRFFLFFF